MNNIPPHEKNPSELKKRGGARPGAGRPKGAVNREKREAKELAKSFVPAVIQELYRLSQKAKSEMARIEAAKTILDRACGKPIQEVAAQVESTIRIDQHDANL